MEDNYLFFPELYSQHHRLGSANIASKALQCIYISSFWPIQPVTTTQLHLGSEKKPRRTCQ